MTDQHYTHTCQVCKTEFPATLNKDGTPRKTKRSFCSAECIATDNRARALSYYHQNKPGDGRHGGACRHCGNDLTSTRKRTYCSVECRTAYNTHKARSAVKPPCAVQGCDSRASGRGLCSKHYRWFMTHGSTEKPPRKARKLKRVTKPCGWCGKEMLLKPGMVDKRKACSVTCANHIRSRAAGYEYRLKTIVCEGCHQQVERTVRTYRDSGRYCSRACAFAVKSRVSAERAALRRIGDRRRASARALYETLVAPEAEALRRIRQNIKARLNECIVCGDRHVKRRPYMTRCSTECEQAYEDAKAQRRRDTARAWKKTPKGRAIRSAGKAARRSNINRTKVEKIDPIAVFENANWICHICGGKTLKSKRGTYHDRAPELEHIVALANGGTHTWSNVACACRKCNIEKGAKDYGQMGLL